MSWGLFMTLAMGTCTLTFWLVWRWMTQEAAPEAAEPQVGVPARARRRAVRAEPERLFASKSTSNVETSCPNHPHQPGTWTCRFCKNDYCTQCARSTAGQRHCPSRRCVEAGRTFAAARKGS